MRTRRAGRATSKKRRTENGRSRGNGRQTATPPSRRKRRLTPAGVVDVARRGTPGERRRKASTKVDATSTSPTDTAWTQRAPEGASKEAGVGQSLSLMRGRRGELVADDKLNSA